MSGTKRLYNLEEKNYFKFFGVEEKQGVASGVSLRTIKRF